MCKLLPQFFVAIEKKKHMQKKQKATVIYLVCISSYLSEKKNEMIFCKHYEYQPLIKSS